MSLDKHRNPNGTYNGVTLMAELTGLGQDEIRAIAEQVKANQAKLDACPWHEFERSTATGMLRSVTHQRYVCRNCGGEVDHHAHYWHELGRRQR